MAEYNSSGFHANIQHTHTHKTKYEARNSEQFAMKLFPSTTNSDHPENSAM